MVVKFNLVFTTIPFFFWFLVYRFNFYLLTIFCLLIILSLSLGLYVDYIHWGSFRNTYYQFYYYNLDETLGRLNEFGVESWYYYITETIKQLAPLLSIFFVFSIVFYWIKNPKEIISWITFITFVAFTFIGHKEIRYIFPIYIFAPLFIAYLLDYIKSKNIKKCFMIIIIFSNIIFLSLTLFFPPNSKVGIYKFIYNNVTHDSKIYYSKENPYLVNNMEPFLYTKFLPNIKKINYEILPKKNFWLATNSYNDIDNIIGHNCRIIFSNYPLKIINLNQNWKRLKINWYIFKCIKN